MLVVQAEGLSLSPSGRTFHRLTRSRSTEGAARSSPAVPRAPIVELSEKARIASNACQVVSTASTLISLQEAPGSSRPGGDPLVESNHDRRPGDAIAGAGRRSSRGDQGDRGAPSRPVGRCLRLCRTREEHAGSDLDFLVDLESRTRPFELLLLGAALEDALGVSVDVGTREGLREELRDKVLAEAVPL